MPSSLSPAMGTISRFTLRRNFLRFSADSGKSHFIRNDEVGTLGKFLLVEADLGAQLGEVVARIAAFLP